MPGQTTACPGQKSQTPVRTCVRLSARGHAGGAAAPSVRAAALAEPAAGCGESSGGMEKRLRGTTMWRTRVPLARRAFGCGSRNHTRSSRTRARATVGMRRSSERTHTLNSEESVGDDKGQQRTTARHEEMRVELEHEFLHSLRFAQRALHPHEGARHAKLVEKWQRL